MTKEFDSRWITQHGALFCVMNGKGQVVTWKLTKDLTFNNIIHVGHLNALRDRVHKESMSVNFSLTTIVHGEICYKVFIEQLYVYI